MVVTDGADDQTLARDMIEVHGSEAATVARENARAAALAVRPRERNNGSGCSGSSSGSSLARIASPGLLLNEAQKAPLKWRVAYTQRRSRVSL